MWFWIWEMICRYGGTVWYWLQVAMQRGGWW